ncbi:MAG: DUF3098 domain-containing protein [Flavobacteriales bacterium]|jgi:hypothetical protein|nr:DUF3098 domain-containing protein [Flavobacteriales bacterium]MCB0757835.1 DUF3098 domain-containing protein [Flavobacteriales bacterium]
MASNTHDALAFEAINYKLLLIGIGIVIIGFILMSGGGSGDPEVFDAEEIFSARRITVAPIVCLIGYVFVIYAIMRKPREEA